MGKSQTGGMHGFADRALLRGPNIAATQGRHQDMLLMLLIHALRRLVQRGMHRVLPGWGKVSLRTDWQGPSSRGGCWDLHSHRSPIVPMRGRLCCSLARCLRRPGRVLPREHRCRAWEPTSGQPPTTWRPRLPPSTASPANSRASDRGWLPWHALPSLLQALMVWDAFQLATLQACTGAVVHHNTGIAFRCPTRCYSSGVTWRSSSHS